MNHREKMSPIDTAWLRMDRPSNLMMIVGILVFEQPLDVARYRLTLERRMLAHFRRFRQRVHHDSVGAWWEDDPEFDLDNHVVRRALPLPAGKEELQQLASELAAEPLNPARPLWRFDIVEDYQGGSALIVRIHHCIADGIALVGVMLAMADLTADAPLPEPPVAAGKKGATPQNPWLGLMDPMSQATMAAMGLSSKFWNGYFNLMLHPEKALKLSQHGLGFTAELGKLLTMPADSHTRLKGKTGTVKRVAWCDRIPLDEVKALGKALGCSVNDVLLSAVAGAIRSYLELRGDPVADVEIRAMVPVNLRSEKHAGKLGNRFGMVTLLLPIYEANPFARLFELRKRMLAMKGSYQPPLTMVLLGISGVAPKIVQEKFLDMLANKASAVMTNVPGPQQPLYLAGSRIDQIMFWVPQSGDIGVGVSILSYNDSVQFGLITDRHFIPDPETLTSLFQAEFDKMMMAMMLHDDWNQPVDPVKFEQDLADDLAVDLPAGEVRKSALAGRRPTPKKPAAEAATPAARIPKRFRGL